MAFCLGVAWCGAVSEGLGLGRERVLMDARLEEEKEKERQARDWFEW